MNISDKGIAFVVKHEGFVSRAYLDPVGVVTIGTGFTNGSKVARRMLGKIKLGMTITREMNDRVLREAFAEEYGPPVTAAMVNPKQHQWDAGASYCFNCGPGAMRDVWVYLFGGGKIKEAAARLRVSRVTAKGVRLRGLENRRAEEAKLLEHGDYGRGIGKADLDPARSIEQPKNTAPDYDLMGWQQKLKDLGYYDGKVDGWHGPKTTAAVRAFQKAHPDLVEDGILGPATLATIERAIAAKTAGAGAGVVVGGGAVATTAIVNSGASWAIWGGITIGVFCLVVGGLMAWRYRNEIKQWFNKGK